MPCAHAGGRLATLFFVASADCRRTARLVNALSCGSPRSGAARTLPPRPTFRILASPRSVALSRPRSAPAASVEFACLCVHLHHSHENCCSTARANFLIQPQSPRLRDRPPGPRCSRCCNYKQHKLSIVFIFHLSARARAPISFVLAIHPLADEFESAWASSSSLRALRDPFRVFSRSPSAPRTRAIRIRCHANASRTRTSRSHSYSNRYRHRVEWKNCPAAAGQQQRRQAQRRGRPIQIWC